MDVMAAKVRIMKMLQEIRGLAEITHRRPQPRKPGLFLIQLRSHVTHTTGVRRKQTIAVEMLDRPDIPHPVKITHLRPASVPPVSPTTTATATATAAAS
jgi:hypothetical protein